MNPLGVELEKPVDASQYTNFVGLDPPIGNSNSDGEPCHFVTMS